MEDIGIHTLQIYLLSNIPPGNPKIKFDSNMLTFDGKTDGFSANPYFTDDVMYNSHEIMKLPYEKRVSIFFNRKEFMNILKSGKKLNKNTEMKTASYNVMTMLRALFPTRFPIENNISDSFGKYGDDFSGIWPEVMKRVTNPAKMIFGDSYYSSIKYNGAVYTFTRIIWINDFLNHPHGKELIKEYQKWKRWVNKSKSTTMETFKEQRIFSKEFLAHRFQTNNPQYEKQKTAKNFLEKNKPYQIFFYDILPKYKDITINSSLHRLLNSKNVGVLINFFENITNNNQEVATENKEGSLDVYILADFIGSDKILTDSDIEEIKCTYYNNSLGNQLDNFVNNKQNVNSEDIFNNRIFFSTKVMKDIEQKEEIKPDIEEYKVDMNSVKILNELNDYEKDGKFDRILTAYYKKSTHEPIKRDEMDAKFSEIFTISEDSKYYDIETKRIINSLKNVLLKMNLNDEEEVNILNITDELYNLKSKFSAQINLNVKQIKKYQDQITAENYRKDYFNNLIKSLENNNEKLTSLTRIINTFITYYEEELPEKLRLAHNKNESHKKIKGGRKKTYKKKGHFQNKRKTYRTCF